MWVDGLCHPFLFPAIFDWMNYILSDLFFCHLKVTETELATHR